MLTACALIVSLPAALALQARMRARPQHRPEPITRDAAPRQGVVDSAGEPARAGEGWF
jgi:hypothetical protein